MQLTKIYELPWPSYRPGKMRTHRSIRIANLQADSLVDLFIKEPYAILKRLNSNKLIG